MLQVRVREETGAAIESLARLWGRTPSETLREVVEDWLREREEQAAKKSGAPY